MSALKMQTVSRKNWNIFLTLLAVILLVMLVMWYRAPHSPKGGMTQYTANIAPQQKNLVTERWIVTTTINSPTKDIDILCKIPGWRVVVIADTKTPKDWSNPPCIFLSIEKQHELGYRINNLIPYKSYSRKSIGHLFAIQHGAKYIYETDDDNHPTDNLASFTFSEETEGLVYSKVNGLDVLNPYAHFGQPSIWPRGFPLDQVGADITQYSYVKCKMRTPIVQQGVVNGDPDVDAIFRLTRKNHARKIDVTFDPKAPPVTFPPGLMSPYNSQNTLHLYNGLWGTVLPHTVTFRITDIWRGYWVQKLLPLIGETISFYPPNAYQERSAHNYITDAIEEEKLYYQTPDLVRFLKEWKCSHTKFFKCAVQLAKDMADRDFWKAEDAELISAWVQDLHDVGYKAPDMIGKPFTSPCKNQAQAQVFSPVKQTTCFAHTPKLGNFNF